MSLYSTTLTHREDLARGTAAFHLAKPDGFRFKPGQALDVILPLAGAAGVEALRHTFSIVTAPQESDIVVATRMRDSEFKRALAGLPPGSPLTLEGPFGSMTLHSDRARAAVFIAGGIGITPFMSMLRQAAQERAARSFVLVYSNRSPEDTAFFAELRELERVLPSFRLVATMTDMGSAPHAWGGPTGMIDASLLRKVGGALQAPVHYVAGPPAMVEAMREALTNIGVADDDIRSEEFFGY